MAAHVWELATDVPSFGDQYRVFKCSRCGAGPIKKNILTGKGSFLELAKQAGISPDCNLQIAKDIMES